MRGEHLAPPVRPLADQRRRRMLADDQIEIGVVGHAVAFVGRPARPRRRRAGVPAPAHVGGHVGEQQIMIDGMPDRPLGEGEPRAQLADRRIGVDQVLEFRPQRRMGHRSALLVVVQAGNQLRLRQRSARSGREPGLAGVRRRRRLRSWPGGRAPAAGSGVVEQLLDRALLGPLGEAVVAGRLRLGVMGLAEGLDDLVVDIVDHVAADRRDALGGMDVDVHRALGMGVRPPRNRLPASVRPAR